MAGVKEELAKRQKLREKMILVHFPYLEEEDKIG